ncbi:MAG: Hsp33 family molecular chaperone HslO [Desulfobacteraceae bacterium]|jgi:molecular chaperone Hsp33
MKKRKRYGETLKEQLQASRRDRLFNFVLSDGTLRGCAVNGTRMVNEMRWNHELGILETLTLGHAYLGAALMSADLKSNDRLGLQVECSGPIKGLSVEANAFGEVRGYLKQVPIPIDKPLESFDLSPFFGAGFLSVTKYLEDARQPFTGKVMMEYGRLAKDLTVYYLQSEQIPTSFSLSVSFNQQGDVQGAGGLMLQAMPGADDAVLSRIEEQVHALASIGEVVQTDQFPEQWIEDNFAQFNPKLLSSRGVEFMCHCNDDRISAMLAMLKPDDLEEMAANGPFPIEVRCHYCNTVYAFSQQEIMTISNVRQSSN